jgi:NADH:ubiquinone oxidoreductase subunit C
VPDEVRTTEVTAWYDSALALRTELGESTATLLSGCEDRRGGIQVVLRVWSLSYVKGVRLTTVVGRPALEVASLTPVWPGLGWWEREAAETWGLTFTGHPDPRPLLGVKRGLDRRDEPWPGSFDPLGRRAPKPLGTA